MIEKKQKIVGFFPWFLSLGETLPAVKIAELYREKGGKIIFFSHGGKFEKIAEDAGFEVVRFGDISSRIKNLDKKREKIIKKWHKTKTEDWIFFIFKQGIIESMVEDEIKNLKKYGIDIIVSFFNITNKISARVLNIPRIVVISGTLIPPYYKYGNITYPDNYENFFTRIIPLKIKNKIVKWILLNSKKNIKYFNKVAKKYKIKKFKTLNDLLLGDINFVCDDINFLDIKPSKIFPEQNFVGPIIGMDFGKKIPDLEKDVEELLKREGRSILLTLGSHYKIDFYIKVLKALNETNYNIIALQPQYDKKISLGLGDNILLKKSVHSIKKVYEKVDLAVIHGGRGTVYSAAYSGKPVIGIPMHIEQQFNLDCLVRKGVGLWISKKFFKKEELLNSIEKIFNNYEFYKENANKLSNQLQPPKGSERIADNLVKIVENLK